MDPTAWLRRNPKQLLRARLDVPQLRHWSQVHSRDGRSSRQPEKQGIGANRAMARVWLWGCQRPGSTRHSLSSSHGMKYPWRCDSLVNRSPSHCSIVCLRSLVLADAAAARCWWWYRLYYSLTSRQMGHPGLFDTSLKLNTYTQDVPASFKWILSKKVEFWKCFTSSQAPLEIQDTIE